MYASIFDEQRSRMVQEQLMDRGIHDFATLRAMAKIPRELFVPKILQERAYQDSALPLSKGQTISQPFIVGFMTQALRLQPDDKVLELGTGSGYQAAVAAELAASVYSYEIVDELYRKARTLLLKKLGYQNITLKSGSGRKGLEAEAPFSKIIVTAAAEKIPQALIEQLASPGRLIIPLKEADGSQQLVLLKKDEQGKIQEQKLLSVIFVSLK
ncbi:MAG: protein-L-isoaspartate(D-aspartate) O-methyltransferase [Candidatus Komeilibacteria bacterium]